MAEDSDSPDKIKQLDVRLNYLEYVARDTVARLYEIEKRLGLVFRAVPRELGTSGRIEDEGQLSRLRAVEEALKAVTPDQAAQHIDRAPLDQGSDASRRPADTSSTVPPTVSSTDAGQPSGPLTDVPSRPTDRHVLGVPVPQGPSPSAHQHRTAQKPQPTVSPISAGKPRNRYDLEARIGGNWFNRIGVLAIFLGVAFFLKYAVDKECGHAAYALRAGVKLIGGYLACAEIAA